MASKMAGELYSRGEPDRQLAFLAGDAAFDSGKLHFLNKDSPFQFWKAVYDRIQAHTAGLWEQTASMHKAMTANACFQPYNLGLTDDLLKDGELELSFGLA